MLSSQIICFDQLLRIETLFVHKEEDELLRKWHIQWLSVDGGSVLEPDVLLGTSDEPLCGSQKPQIVQFFASPHVMFETTLMSMPMASGSTNS